MRVTKLNQIVAIVAAATSCLRVKSPAIPERKLENPAGSQSELSRRRPDNCRCDLGGPKQRWLLAACY
jgi:hypothetical protein